MNWKLSICCRSLSRLMLKVMLHDVTVVLFDAYDRDVAVGVTQDLDLDSVQVQ